MKLAFLALLSCAVAMFGAELAIGSKAPDFALTAVDGSAVSSMSLLGAKATVVGFVAARCPVSNAYNQRMIALYRDFSARGVAFVFMNSNSNETAGEMKVHARQAALEFTVYRDVANRTADLFGAQTTPEMFLLDAGGTLRYRGAIDDAQTEARVKVRGLRLAIEAVLAGKPVEPERTRAFGCALHRVRT